MKQVEEDIKVELDDKKLASIINKWLRINPVSRPSFSEIVKKLRDYISIDLASRISKDSLDYLFERASVHVEKEDINSVEEVLNQLKEIASYNASTSVDLHIILLF